MNMSVPHGPPMGLCKKKILLTFSIILWPYLVANDEGSSYLASALAMTGMMPTKRFPPLQSTDVSEGAAGADTD